MKTMKINPWQWQERFGYAQAVAVSNNQGTLYCSGQAAMTAEGLPAGGTMKNQILLSLTNLDAVAKAAGYELQNMVRLVIYTTSINDLFNDYPILKQWLKENKSVPSCTLIEVGQLAFPELMVEFEAVIVK